MSKNPHIKKILTAQDSKRFDIILEAISQNGICAAGDIKVGLSTVNKRFWHSARRVDTSERGSKYSSVKKETCHAKPRLDSELDSALWLIVTRLRLLPRFDSYSDIRDGPNKMRWREICWDTYSLSLSFTP